MNFFNINLDMSSVVSFLDTATPIMEGIVDLHNHIFFLFNFNFNSCFMGFR